MNISSSKRDELRTAFEHVGGIVVTHSEIDAAFSEFLGMVFSNRIELGLLEPIFKTIDTNRKIEIFKAFIRKSDDPAFQKIGLDLCAKIEKVSARRNIVCHGLPWHNDGRSGLKLDSAAKYLHRKRDKYVVYFDELLSDLISARKVLEHIRMFCDTYKATALQAAKPTKPI
jgi:hypothetical protein